jgi:hypothetical protein
MEDNGYYQKQRYSSAATASSRRSKCHFHIVHYVAEDLSGGHFAMLELHASADAQNYSSDD